MQRKPFILLILLTISAASRAATDDLDSTSFMGVDWVWIFLALSLYVVFGVIFLLMRCAKPLPIRMQSKISIYKAILKQAVTAAGARVTGGPAVAAARRPGVRSNRRGAERITPELKVQRARPRR
jgi:hypothetical protein